MRQGAWIACLAVSASAANAQSPLVGTWVGDLRNGSERQTMALRFAMDEKQGLVLYFSQPEMKFYDLGPGPVERHGDQYSSPPLTFTLDSATHHITGAMTFDGNDLTFDLAPGPTPPAPAPRPSTAPIASARWTFKTDSAIWSSPVVDAGAVYFGSNDRGIYALDAARGTLRWRTATGGWVMGRPTIDGNALYALADDGFLYKLNKQTGRVIWRFDTHGGAVGRSMPNPPDSLAYDYLTSAATVAGGTVYIGSADKRLYAVDAASGRERWRFETGDIVRSTPAVDRGIVYFGSRDHNVYAVDARTGALRWKHDTEREVVSSPLIANGMVYIGSRNSNLFAFDAATGAVRWKSFYWSSWVESSARLADGVLYIGSSDYQQALAIDAATGRKLWTFGTDGSAWSTPAVTEHLVYIGAVGIPHMDLIHHHGGFFAIDRQTGNAVWRYPMGEIPGSNTYGVASSPTVANGLVYFGGLDGTFYAFPTGVATVRE
jgi:outer membrane protein assembly factor BamB